MLSTKDSDFIFLWQFTLSRQHTKSQRYSFANEGPYSQSYGFSSSYVQMWQLDPKDSWVLKNWWFQLVVLEKTLESPLDCREIKPVHPKGNQPKYSLEGLMLKLKFQYFGHLMWRMDSLEKTLMLGKIEGKRRRRLQRMRWLDSITDSTDSTEFEQTLGDSGGQRSLACWSPWSCIQSDTT